MLRACGLGRWLPWVALCGACGTGPSRTDPFGGPGGLPPPPPAPDAAVLDASAGQCTASAQCDDRIPCTDDECVFGGRCEHTPVTSRCPAGQRCFPDRGCASGTRCAANTDCDDGVPCTRDLCGADGSCQNINDDTRCTMGQVCTSGGCAAAGTCRNDNDCNNRRFCDGVERCADGRCVAGVAMDCADNDPCTGDVCNEAMMRCDHPPVSPCGGTVTAGTYVLNPPIVYRCPSYALGPISTVTLEVSAAGVTVAGLPVLLSGPRPPGGMFSTTGRDVSGNTFVLSFQGNFTAANQFTGAFSAACPDCSALSMCPTGSSIFVATRR